MAHKDHPNKYKKDLSYQEIGVVIGMPGGFKKQKHVHNTKPNLFNSIIRNVHVLISNVYMYYKNTIPNVRYLGQGQMEKS